MNILHTADWHLGQRFLFNDREEEHQLALDWLLQTILDRQIEVLIVAGDIFDISNPPNYARTQYYGFLTQLLTTACRHIVIIGGNHDSPSMLHAPKALLRALNIYVVGAKAEHLEDDLLLLKDEKGDLELLIAAVPFLRYRDLEVSIAGEGGLERIARIQTGLVRHYQAMAELAKPYEASNVPIIATGHLYATGAKAADKQDNIYIGNIENINADDFPALFDYIALGHIHRAQIVGAHPHIRYAGSLIPLSFSETQDTKSVYLLQTEKKTIKTIEQLEVPVFRRLKTIAGPLSKVKEDLRRFAEKEREGLTPWVEVIVETDQVIPQLDQELKAFTAEMDLEVLKIKLNRTYQPIDRQYEDTPDLSELDALDVFKKKCESFGSPPEDMEELIRTFLELQDWMKEKEEDRR
ncbi:MAG: exonuclease SbcCD subunit D C-terminal domain-containing protein [Saprospiraceae bacterium]